MTESAPTQNTRVPLSARVCFALVRIRSLPLAELVNGVLRSIYPARRVKGSKAFRQWLLLT
jgi:hypothetical protein